MLPAVVLAAGESRRMGTPKALLRAPCGRAFVSRIVESLAAAGLDDIVIVTGRHHDPIAKEIAAEAFPVRPRLARNDDPARGQLSSIWVGMDAAVSAATQGLLVTLTDIPLVRVDTIRAVIDAWRQTRAPIVRPALGGEHGHPVIFDRAVFDELRRAPIELGAKAVVRARAAAVHDVAVADRGCLVDVDTPDDYEALVKRSEA